MRISDWSSDVCSSDLRRFTTPPVVYGINANTVFFVSGLVPRMLTRIDVAEGINLRQWLYQTLYTPWLSPDRKSVVLGKSVSVRVDLGGRRYIKKKNIVKSLCKRQTRKKRNKKI